MVVGMQVLLVLGVLGDVQARGEVVAGHTGGDDGLLDDLCDCTCNIDVEKLVPCLQTSLNWYQLLAHYPLR